MKSNMARVQNKWPGIRKIWPGIRKIWPLLSSWVGLGVSSRLFRLFWSCQEVPGRTREAPGNGSGRSICLFFMVQRKKVNERSNNDGFTSIFECFSALFLCYMLSFVAFLAAWPAAPRIYKKHEIPLFFVGRKPNVPFSRSARSKQISEGMRSKHRWKMSSTTESTGPGTT